MGGRPRCVAACLVIVGCDRALPPTRPRAAPRVAVRVLTDVPQPTPAPAVARPTAIDVMVPVPPALAPARLVGATRMGTRPVLLFDRAHHAGAAAQYTLVLAAVAERALAVLRTHTVTMRAFPQDASWRGLPARSLRDDDPPAACGREAQFDGDVEVGAEVPAFAALFAVDALVPIGGGPSSLQPARPGYVRTESDWYVAAGLHGLVARVRERGAGRGHDRRVVVEFRDATPDGRATAVRARHTVVRYSDPERGLPPVDFAVQRTPTASAAVVWRRAALAPAGRVEAVLFDAAHRPRWRTAVSLPAEDGGVAPDARSLEIRDGALLVTAMTATTPEAPHLVLMAFDARGRPRTRRFVVSQDSGGEGDLVACGGAAWVRSWALDERGAAVVVRRFDIASGAGDAQTRWTSPPLPAAMRWELGPMACHNGEVSMLVSVHDQPAPGSSCAPPECNRTHTRAVALVAWR